MQEDTFRWIITIAVAIATLCIFLMAGAAVAMYAVIAKMKAKADGIIAKVDPLLDTARQLAHDNGPKFTVLATRATEIAANAKDISDVAKDQAHRFAEVGRDIADRTKVQVARVDSVVDETVSQAHVVGTGVRQAVMKPVREASGVVAGIKAAVSTMAAGRRTSVDHITQDEEMFI